jgi:hypothetical protein
MKPSNIIVKHCNFPSHPANKDLKEVNVRIWRPGPPRFSCRNHGRRKHSLSLGLHFEVKSLHLSHENWESNWKNMALSYGRSHFSYQRRFPVQWKQFSSTIISELKRIPFRCVFLKERWRFLNLDMTTTSQRINDP